MKYDANEVVQKVDRMAQIKTQMEKLKTEQSELEGFFLQICNDDLENTKLKTVAYTGSNANKVTATMAENLKAVYPSYFKIIFGSAYSDAVTEETKYKLSAPATRMLTGLWQQNYTKLTVAEVIGQLPCDEEVKKALGKKLKGANFKTDVKNLVAIGGFDKQSAEEYAYFVSEASVWENFLQLMQVNKITGDNEIKSILETIKGAVVVEETPKIQVEAS